MSQDEQTAAAHAQVVRTTGRHIHVLKGTRFLAFLAFPRKTAVEDRGSLLSVHFLAMAEDVDLAHWQAEAEAQLFDAIELEVFQATRLHMHLTRLEEQKEQQRKRDRELREQQLRIWKEEGLARLQADPRYRTGSPTTMTTQTTPCKETSGWPTRAATSSAPQTGKLRTNTRTNLAVSPTCCTRLVVGQL